MPAPEPIPDLLKAVNEASRKAFALWITFLTVSVYLAISIGTTTHLQLLLAGPVKLPLLSVDMRLLAFYGFAPPLYVVMHLYVLMQLYLLSRLLRRFDNQLYTARMLEQDRGAIRDQLDKFVFTQSLIGGPPDRTVRSFLRAVVLLSFILGPVLLFLAFQLRFLPCHSIPATYVHRVTLLLDLVLLALLWPKISRGRAQHADAPHGRKTFFRIGVAVSFLLIVFSVLVATVPGELTNQPWLRNWDESLFSQNIMLGGERLIEPDEDKLRNCSVTLSLSRRDFREAFLLAADLRKADLRFTDLTGAELSSATLSHSKLIAAQLSGSDLGQADLTGADLSGANLVSARMSSALLLGAHLASANLSNADLLDANLSNANLTYANLSSARLLGAHLSHTNLSHANLSNAHLRANLSGANLGVANLTRANLTDADLTDADLSGAKNLEQRQLDEACGIDAKLPPGLTLKRCPPK